MGTKFTIYLTALQLLFLGVCARAAVTEEDKKIVRGEVATMCTGPSAKWQGYCPANEIINMLVAAPDDHRLEVLDALIGDAIAELNAYIPKLEKICKDVDLIAYAAEQGSYSWPNLYAKSVSDFKSTTGMLGPLVRSEAFSLTSVLDPPGNSTDQSDPGYWKAKKANCDVGVEVLSKTRLVQYQKLRRWYELRPKVKSATASDESVVEAIKEFNKIGKKYNLNERGPEVEDGNKKTVPPKNEPGGPKRWPFPPQRSRPT